MSTVSSTVFNPADSSNWMDLAGNPFTPASVLMQLAQTTGAIELRVLVAQHNQADSAVLTVLARDMALPVRSAVAGHRDLPKSVLNILENDADESIRKAVKAQISRGSEPISPVDLAESVWTSARQLEDFLVHASSRVRRTAARNSSTPVAALERLKHLEIGDPQVTPEEFEYFAATGPYACSLIAKHPNAPEKLLEEFITTRFRNDVAENPHTPVRLLEKLILDPDVRPFVARNPSLPLQWQNEFLNDERWNVREALASNPNASRKVLEVLSLDSDWEVREALAENPAISPDVIDRLAGDSWDLVRELVAAHPNAAPKTLDELATSRTLPGLADDHDQDIHLAVAENANTSPATLERLANHKDVRIRAAVATHPNIPQSLLDRLSEDKSTWVQRLVQLRDPEVSAEALIEAARTRKTASRVIAAMNPNTPTATLERLARDEQPRVRAFVVGNPNCPAQTIEFLKNDSRADVAMIAISLEFVGFSETLVQQTFGQQAAKYLRSPDARFRRAIAASPRAIPERLEVFARDHDRGVLLALAANPKTPTYILQGLAHDETLRRIVALNPNAVENVQLEVERLDVAAATAGENTITRMRRLARNARVPVRLALAANPITPEDLLQQLADDKEASVRIRVLQNRNTPVKTLIALTRDADQKVRLALAKRDPIIYPELLAELASDFDTAIRQVIAERSETPTHALEKLSRFDKLHVTLATNPSSTASILNQIVHSNKPEVWALAASHPNTAGKTLEYMARDSFGTALRSINFSKKGWLHSFLLGRTKSRAQMYEQISRHPNVTPRLTAHFSMLREAGYLKQNVFLGSQRPNRIQPEFSSANITLELPPLRPVTPDLESSNGETDKDTN